MKRAAKALLIILAIVAAPIILVWALANIKETRR